MALTDKDAIGLIASSIIVLLFGFIIAAFVVCFCYRRRKRQPRNHILREWSSRDNSYYRTQQALEKNGKHRDHGKARRGSNSTSSNGELSRRISGYKPKILGQDSKTGAEELVISEVLENQDQETKHVTRHIQTVVNQNQTSNNNVGYGKSVVTTNVTRSSEDDKEKTIVTTAQNGKLMSVLDVNVHEGRRLNGHVPSRVHQVVEGFILTKSTEEGQLVRGHHVVQSNSEVETEVKGHQILTVEKKHEQKQKNLPQMHFGGTVVKGHTFYTDGGAEIVQGHLVGSTPGGSQVTKGHVVKQHIVVGDGGTLVIGNPNADSNTGMRVLGHPSHEQFTENPDIYFTRESSTYGPQLVLGHQSTGSPDSANVFTTYNTTNQEHIQQLGYLRPISDHYVANWPVADGHGAPVVITSSQSPAPAIFVTNPTGQDEGKSQAIQSTDRSYTFTIDTTANNPGEDVIVGRRQEEAVSEFVSDHSNYKVIKKHASQKIPDWFVKTVAEGGHTVDFGDEVDLSRSASPRNVKSPQFDGVSLSTGDVRDHYYSSLEQQQREKEKQLQQWRHSGGVKVIGGEHEDGTSSKQIAGDRDFVRTDVSVAGIDSVIPNRNAWVSMYVSGGSNSDGHINTQTQNIKNQRMDVSNSSKSLDRSGMITSSGNTSDRASSIHGKTKTAAVSFEQKTRSVETTSEVATQTASIQTSRMKMASMRQQVNESADRIPPVFTSTPRVPQEIQVEVATIRRQDQIFEWIDYDG